MELIPDEFHPKIENRSKSAFSGGAGCTFEFCTIDGKPCVIKSKRKLDLHHDGGGNSSNDNLELININLGNIFNIYPEFEMLKLFRCSPYILNCFYYSIDDCKFSIFVDRYQYPLDKRLSERQKLDDYYSPIQCMMIANELALAICAIHEEDKDDPIIHRDIKPQNIFVNFKGELEEICLADFGLTAHLSSIQEERKNEQNKIIPGTKGYLAPEVESDGIFSTASDIYAYGIVLLELLTFDKNYETAKLHENFSKELYKPISTLATICVKDNPDERPTAELIVNHLNTQIEKANYPKKRNIASPRQASMMMKGKGREPIASLKEPIDRKKRSITLTGTSFSFRSERNVRQ